MKLSLFHDLVAWSSPCEDIQGRFLIIDMMCGRNIISEKWKRRGYLSIILNESCQILRRLIIKTCVEQHLFEIFLNNQIHIYMKKKAKRSHPPLQTKKGHVNSIQDASV